MKNNKLLLTLATCGLMSSSAFGMKRKQDFENDNHKTQKIVKKESKSIFVPDEIIVLIFEFFLGETPSTTTYDPLVYSTYQVNIMKLRNKRTNLLQDFSNARLVCEQWNKTLITNKKLILQVCKLLNSWTSHDVDMPHHNPFCAAIKINSPVNIIKELSGQENERALLSLAFRYRHLDLIEERITNKQIDLSHKYDYKTHDLLMKKAIKEDKKKVIRFMITINESLPIKFVAYAILIPNLTVIEYLIRVKNYNFFEADALKILKKAINENNPFIVDWILKKYPYISITKEDLQAMPKKFPEELKRELNKRVTVDNENESSLIL